MSPSSLPFSKAPEQRLMPPQEQKEKETTETIEPAREVGALHEVHEQPRVEDSLGAETSQPVSPVATDAHPALTVSKSALLEQIEHVLEEDLSEIYFSLSPEEQSRFRVKGEETAKNIETLFQKARATAERVLALIRAWLRVIPGVNHFFIEQESKVKTDRIIKLKGR